MRYEYDPDSGLAPYIDSRNGMEVWDRGQVVQSCGVACYLDRESGDMVALMLNYPAYRLVVDDVRADR